MPMAEKRKYKMGTCADCGGPMKMAAKNQKYCTTCRLGRQAAWQDGRTSECPLCGEDFINWSGDKGATAHLSCGRCFIERAPAGQRESVVGTCGWHEQGTCHSDTPTVVYSEHIALCFPCLTDPKKHADNRLAIKAKHRAMVKARG